MWPALAALVALLLLAYAPSTGWIERLQFRLLFEPPRALYALYYDLGVESPQAKQDERTPASRLEALVKSHPDDYQIQLAWALEGGAPDAIVHRLRGLVPHFPNRPDLRAHILRYSCSRDISFHRDEEYLLTGDPPPKTQTAPPSPGLLEAFDRDALAGERLDPGNGAFPMMRAAGLFAAHRDAEAVAAVERASTKPDWNDYIAEETRSRWLVREMLYGRQSATQRTVVYAAILFPHYARLRQVARMQTYLAVVQERAGQAERGLSMRRAQLRCGDLLRDHSSTSIGGLVGIAISAISTSRAGGGPAVKRPANVTVDAWIQKRLDDFAAFATRNGHPEDGERARASTAAGEKYKQITRKGILDSPMGGRPFFALTGLWIAGMILLGNLLWMLIMAGGAALLARSDARWRTVGILLGFGLFALGVMAWALSQWGEALMVLSQVERNLVGEGGGIDLPPWLSRTLAIVATLLVPLMVTGIVLIVTAARRKAPAPAMARGLAGAGLVLATVYAVLLFQTGVREAQVSEGMEQTLKGEARYFARLQREPWPVSALPKPTSPAARTPRRRPPAL